MRERRSQLFAIILLAVFLPAWLHHLPLSAQSAGERIWLHTDAPAYKIGERIHFRAYVLDMDDKLSTAEDRYLYVEMGRNNRMLGKRVKVMEREGVYEGFIDIPEEATAGVYSLRAYTLRMGQAGVFCYQDIQVGRPHYLQAETAQSLFDSFESLSVPVRVQLTSRQDSALLQLDMSGLREGEWADLSLSVFSGNYAPLPPAWIGSVQGAFPEPEDTQTLSGTVTTFWRRRPVKDAPVGLISPQAGIMATTVTDEKGVFSFDGLDFPEGTQYLVRTDEKHDIEVRETVYPAFSSSGRRYRDDGWAAPLSEWADDAIELSAASVSTTAVVDPPKGFSALADYTIGPHQIESIGATSMHEILLRAPSVFLRDDQAYIRGDVSIFAAVPAAIAIDGIIVEDIELDSIIMPDVERVDVFKTGRSVIWGARGGGGVISITTKSGNYIPQQVSEYQNQKKALPLGYQRPAKYSPIGQSLYWNPAVRTDSLSVAVPQDGAVSAFLSGITSEGRIVNQFITIR